MPWSTAKVMLTVEDDGLTFPWWGFVWMNPPYGRALGAWLEKLAKHNNGIALIFARTDTQAFHKHVFPHYSSIVWLKGRLTFHKPDGTAPLYNSGGPSALIGYGEEARIQLRRCADIGAITERGNESL
jgi:hypothetical protein